MDHREHDFTNTQVSESVMERYKARQHPEFEQEKFALIKSIQTRKDAANPDNPYMKLLRKATLNISNDKL